MTTHQEPVYRFRVMRRMHSKTRNPDGAWSLVYSTPDLESAVAEMKEQVDVWACCGDAFMIVDAGVPVQYITRAAW